MPSIARDFESEAGHDPQVPIHITELALLVVRKSGGAGGVKRRAPRDPGNDLRVVFVFGVSIADGIRLMT